MQGEEGELAGLLGGVRTEVERLQAEVRGIHPHPGSKQERLGSKPSPMVCAVGARLGGRRRRGAARIKWDQQRTKVAVGLVPAPDPVVLLAGGL